MNTRFFGTTVRLAMAVFASIEYASLFGMVMFADMNTLRTLYASVLANSTTLRKLDISVLANTTIPSRLCNAMPANIGIKTASAEQPLRCGGPSRHSANENTNIYRI